MENHRQFSYDLNQIFYDYTMEVTNRFRGLDLVDRVPEELCMELCNIIQEALSKAIPKKKKCKKAKWLFEEALPIAQERSQKQGRRKIHPADCRVPEKSKEREIRRPSEVSNAKK